MSDAALVKRLPLYIGGFMGPFGTVVIVPMFPELREEFDASSGAVGLGFSLYLIPFAALLLVSGTLGERWGRRRTVRATYIIYAAASVGAALAPSLGLFVTARAVQGAANAFITPLLVAGLAETVEPERLGHQLGIYSSFQALGTGLGPVVGGIAADTTWQWAFWGSALAAALLAMAPPDGEPRADALPPPVRPLMTWRMLRLGTAFLFAAAGPVGIAVLVGVAGRDVLDLSGTATGAILFVGAMTALLLGPLWGQLFDRLGPRRSGVVAVAGATAAGALLAMGDRAWTLGVIWAIGGALAAFVVVVFQGVGATIVPDNRGGALSFLLSFRFLGHALGPLVFIPLMEESPDATLVAAAALGLVTLAGIATYRPT